MFRKKMSKKKSKRDFIKKSGTHVKNRVKTYLRRGGIRL